MDNNMHFLFGIIIGAMTQTSILYIGYYIYTNCRRDITHHQHESHESYDAADWWKHNRNNDLN